MFKTPNFLLDTRKKHESDVFKLFLVKDSSKFWKHAVNQCYLSVFPLIPQLSQVDVSWYRLSCKSALDSSSSCVTWALGIIQRDLIRTLRRSSEEIVRGVCQGYSKPSRMGLAEKAECLQSQWKMKRRLALCLRVCPLAPELAYSHALALALAQAFRLFFLEDAWMIMLQLPAFPNRWYFVWEGTPGIA